MLKVIEDNPVKFIETIEKASQKAQIAMAEKEKKKRLEELEKEFKNPKKPEISESRAIRGAKDAPITIVEYSDFQCPYCTKGYEIIKDLMAKYENKVRFIYKHLPLTFHEHAMLSSQYFEAIAMQSPEKAYQFHDTIFENHRSIAKGEEWFKEICEKLGLDMNKLAEDIKSDAVNKIIDADMEEASKFDITGTPGFLINGISLRGAYPLPAFEKIIKRLLEEKDNS
ncbi:MAG: thioredoxin domain-containing protein [Nitrospinae bacterium]|nr:thioredoxin domain-containing protein [Nitrospinota bacterium]